ncbi:acetyltransferase (GNAT) domain-containing protein [Ditylenchus destructor]|uniref:Acetyltransferase (GNAT) domain-containing protein n=1 Tax=Ditylenchus destructor TaxID=166010 RepID=A0AAD4NJY1_9BILA|nr:acetyltransferase (GNAT) domain-containing protein [Ditylenchus destructor]
MNKNFNVSGDISIRQSKKEDLEQIIAIHNSAFGGSLEGHIVSSLLRDLPDNKIISIVGSIHGQIVGHVLFSPVSIHSNGTEIGYPHLMGLAPLGVQPTTQSRGVGSALTEAGLVECRRRGVKAVFVLGHPAYYTRFAFEPAIKWSITYDKMESTDAFMVLELQKGFLQEQKLESAILKYSHEFNAAIEKNEQSNKKEEN